MNICKDWSQWLKETRFSYMDEAQLQQTLNWLNSVKDAVLANAELKKNDKIIDIGTGTGLLGFGALEMLQGSGEVIFSDKFEDCLTECKNLLQKIGVKSGYSFLHCGCEKLDLVDNSIDKALMRSVLVHILDKQAAISEIYRILKLEGIFSAFEPIIRSNTRYYELVNPSNISDFEQFKNAEAQFMSSDDDPLTNFDEKTLAQNLENAGFSAANINLQVAESNYIATAQMVETWFKSPPSPGAATMKDKFLLYFDENKVDNFIKELQLDLDNKPISVKSNTVFIKAVK